MSTPSPGRNAAIAELFSYDSFRDFLRDWFAEEKRINPRFSHRWFATRAGFKSSGFCSLLMSGARNLGEPAIPRMVAALGLVSRPAAYFAALVHLNQAKNLEERLLHLEELKRLRKAGGFAKLKSNQFPYWEDWYLVVVRELVVHAQWNDDPQKLGRLVRPAITAEKARRALERLMEMGLVSKDEQGCWIKSDPILTADGTPPALLRDFKREMILRGLEAMDNLPVQQRHFSAATLCISRKTYKEMCERIDKLREEMLQAATEEPGELVFQANFQVFPLSEAFLP